MTRTINVYDSFKKYKYKIKHMINLRTHWKYLKIELLTITFLINNGIYLESKYWNV